MAVHGEALLEQATLYPDLAAAIADCQRVVATSGRIETESLPLSKPGPALRWLCQDNNGKSGSNTTMAALVFGREDRGLSHAELLQAGRVVRLATSEAYASLNLSHAVAICLHELQDCRTQPLPPATNPSPTTLSDGDLCNRGALEAALGRTLPPARPIGAGGGLPLPPHGGGTDGQAAGATATSPGAGAGGGAAARHGASTALGSPARDPLTSDPTASRQHP